MSAAVQAAVSWAFEVGARTRVEAFVMTSNVRSIAVLERNGFQRDQLLKGHRFAGGIPRDFYLYSIGSREPNPD
jgi:ribosomal-protein-alanine N-acetyltransferase